MIVDGKVVGHYEGGVKKYYYTDAIGSTRAVVNSSGTVLEAHDYYPFGLPMPSRNYGSGTKERFTGQEHDGETGLDYFGARYYMPAYGRWASVDPTGMEPCPFDASQECGTILPEVVFTAERDFSIQDFNIAFDRALQQAAPALPIVLAEPSWIGEALYSVAVTGLVLQEIFPKVFGGEMPQVLDQPKSHILPADRNAGKTVGEILKGKKGSIRNAPLPPGTPRIEDLERENVRWEEIVEKAKTSKGYRTLKKLLSDKRFDK